MSSTVVHKRVSPMKRQALYHVCGAKIPVAMLKLNSTRECCATRWKKVTCKQCLREKPKEK